MFEIEIIPTDDGRFAVTLNGIVTAIKATRAQAAEEAAELRASL